MTDMTKISDAALRVAHLATKTFEGKTDQPTLDRAIVDMGKLMDKLDDDIVLDAMSRLGLEPEDVAAEDGAPARWNMVDEENAYRVMQQNGMTIDTGDGNAHILHNFSTDQAMTHELRIGHVWCRADLCHSTPVLAQLVTDDGHFNRSVDIRPWLQAESGEDILAMIERDFDGSTERDEIAYHLQRVGDPTVVAMFAYQDLVPIDEFTGGTNGFEIEPQSTDEVIAWLKLNRPEIDLPDAEGMEP